MGAIIHFFAPFGNTANGGFMRIALGCAILATVLGCGQARPVSEEDKAALRAGADSFEVLVRAGNDTGVAQLYTENAVLMPPNEGIVEGRAAIRAYFEKQPPEMELELTPVDLDGRGDLAYVRGTYVVSVPGTGGEPTIVDRGKYLEVQRRAGGNEWRIAVDMFNSDMPAPAPPPPPSGRQSRTPRN